MTSGERTKAMRVRRALAGLCRNGAHPVAGDGSQCDDCQGEAREWYAARKAEGCPRCGRPRDSRHVHCAECRGRSAAHMRATRARPGAALDGGR